MAVLIVTESCFGNTRTIADAVAAGAARAAEPVTVVDAADAPLDLPTDLDLLLVGAPTHGFSLPGAQSRRQAVEKGAAIGADPAGRTGVREWLEQVRAQPDLRAVSFDTSVRMRFQPTAARAIARGLRRRGFGRAEKGPSFFVTGTTGPLAEGETERAVQWGESLCGSADRPRV